MADHTETETETGSNAGFRPRGRRVVLVLYATIVAITGLTGYLLGSIGPDGLRPVSFLGLLTLPPTPLGLALYGVLTLGLGLGVVLALVAYVADRYA